MSSAMTVVFISFHLVSLSFFHKLNERMKQAYGEMEGSIFMQRLNVKRQLL